MSKEDMEVLQARIQAAKLKYEKERRKEFILEMKKKGTSFWKDFKAFITKGNILDLAVAVVIGNAFNAIINALVNKIIMPAIGVLTGKASLADLDAWIVKPDYTQDPETGLDVIVEGTGAGHIEYGLFLQAIVNFLIIALTIFIVVRFLRSSRAKLAFREREKAEAEAKAAAEAKAQAEAEAAAAAEAKAKADAEAAALAAEKEAEQRRFYEATAKQTELLQAILDKMNK